MAIHRRVFCTQNRLLRAPGRCKMNSKHKRLTALLFPPGMVSMGFRWIVCIPGLQSPRNINQRMKTFLEQNAYLCQTATRVPLVIDVTRKLTCGQNMFSRFLGISRLESADHFLEWSKKSGPSLRYYTGGRTVCVQERATQADERTNMCHYSIATHTVPRGSGFG